MFWPFRRKPKFEPDLEAFNEALVRSVNLHHHNHVAVARDFRHLFFGDNPEMGKRVLFMLLTWCGEYDVDTEDERFPPLADGELQRWAGKREIAAKIKAALYAHVEPVPEQPREE
jgi:hypothetical protein|tara:strand:- start:2470 stop:2814 length:345 start_codon:yes stop_codon:yes gene_type:complete